MSADIMDSMKATLCLHTLLFQLVQVMSLFRDYLPKGFSIHSYRFLCVAPDLHSITFLDSWRENIEYPEPLPCQSHHTVLYH